MRFANPRARTRGTRSMFAVVQLRPVEPDEADYYLRAWEHPLGALNRAFGREDWLREVDGRPIAVATSASIVGTCARRFENGKPAAESIPMKECVELARIARHPDHRRALRAMLRDWTDHLAPAWQDWPAKWAVSYAMPGHPGHLYHADGWTNWGRRKASTGGVLGAALVVWWDSPMASPRCGSTNWKLARMFPSEPPIRVEQLRLGQLRPFRRRPFGGSAVSLSEARFAALPRRSHAWLAAWPGRPWHRRGLPRFFVRLRVLRMQETRRASEARAGSATSAVGDRRMNCPTPTKVSYRTKRKAIRAAEGVRTHVGLQIRYAYKCECGAWRLTSTPRSRPRDADSQVELPTMPLLAPPAPRQPWGAASSPPETCRLTRGEERRWQRQQSPISRSSSPPARFAARCAPASMR